MRKNNTIPAIIALIVLFATGCSGNKRKNVEARTYVKYWRHYTVLDSSKTIAENLSDDDTDFVWYMVRKTALDSLIDYPSEAVTNYHIEKFSIVKGVKIYKLSTGELDFEIGTMLYCKEYGPLVKQVGKGEWERLERIEIKEGNKTVQKNDLNPLSYSVMCDTVLRPIAPLPPPFIR